MHWASKNNYIILAGIVMAVETRGETSMKERFKRPSFYYPGHFENLKVIHSSTLMLCIANEDDRKGQLRTSTEPCMTFTKLR